jgi:hypothetical protein
MEREGLMAKFCSDLDCKLKNSDSVWNIDSPLIFESDILGKIIVPQNFQTDFASVPRVPIAYTMFGDRAHMESVIHDYLYRKDSVPQATYSQANDVFLEAMKVRGKSFFVRYAMYWGVVLGGWTAYHKLNVNDKLV